MFVQLTFKPWETPCSEKLSNLRSSINRSTLRRKIFWLCALVSPTPQKSDGNICESTARQKADTIFVGVERSSIEGFRAGTLVVSVTVESIDRVLNEICVFSLDTSEVSSGSFALYFVAWSRTWKLVLLFEGAATSSYGAIVLKQFLVRAPSMLDL
jgi:hypothetical protein